MMRRLTVGLVLVMGSHLSAQEVGSRVSESAGSTGTVAGSPEASDAAPGEQAGGEGESDSTKSPPKSLMDRLLRVLSQEEDPDGPINTDRPTFTPSHVVVPKGRLQFESGWTFSFEKSAQMRAYLYDFPELAARYGLTKFLEFRMFWSGETFNSERLARRRLPVRSINGPGDMEVGFKWQLFPGDEKRKWIPTTALITSIIAPTGGSSPYSSETVEPYINLIYGWNPTKKLTIAGSTGYLGIREQGAPNALPRSDNFQRWHQSIVAFFSPTDRATLFYEWYILMYTDAPDNRPLNFMDGGLIYHLTPNMQVDIRAGFGLSGRLDDFFTGTGFSVRF
jgi:hypothetical protein